MNSRIVPIRQFPLMALAEPQPLSPFTLLAVEQVKQAIELAFPWINPATEWQAFIVEWTVFISTPGSLKPGLPVKRRNAVLKCLLDPSSRLTTAIPVEEPEITFRMTPVAEDTKIITACKVRFDMPNDLFCAVGFIKKEWLSWFKNGKGKFKTARVGNSIDFDDCDHGPVRITAKTQVVISPSGNAVMVSEKRRPPLSLRILGATTKISPPVWFRPSDPKAFQEVLKRLSPTGSCAGPPGEDSEEG